MLCPVHPQPRLLKLNCLRAHSPPHSIVLRSHGMLSRVRVISSSSRHVTSLRLHFRCLKPPCSTLATFSRLPDQTSPNGQPSDRIDFTELVDNPNEEYGEYTSLDSKVDHYPTSPHEPTYKSSRAPLSSLLPPPPTANHSSQRTFLNHSRRTGLNPASTVFTGTRYEYLTLSSLRRLGLELAKVGGTGDRGVDLVGFWHLPQWNHSSAQGTAVKDISD